MAALFPHPTPVQTIGTAVLAHPLGPRELPVIGVVIAGPGAAGAAAVPRWQVYDIQTGARALTAAGALAPDLIATQVVAGAAPGTPTYHARVVAALPTMAGLIDLVRNQSSLLSKLIHLRSLAPPPLLRYQNEKYQILGWVVMNPGPGVAIARHEDIPPLIPHPAVTIPLASFGEISVWADVPAVNAPAPTPVNVSVNTTRDHVHNPDGTLRLRDAYFLGMEVPKAWKGVTTKWATYGSVKAGMTNMPSPCALENNLILLDPCWHFYMALIHSAPADYPHEKNADAVHWSMTIKEKLKTFMILELSNERDHTKPGAHLPLLQLMEDFEHLEYLLALIVRSTDDPVNGADKLLLLLMQVLVRVLGRKKNFDYELKPRAQNNRTNPPWLYRLKVPVEKRPREDDQ